MRYVAKFLLLFIVLCTSACINVEPQKPVIVNGVAGYLEKVRLPQDSRITIAIIDLNTPGAIVAQKSFNVARVPVPFKFLLPAESIDRSINYAVVASIQYKGQLIFQTYNKYPVIHNGITTAEVIMKRAR